MSIKGYKSAALLVGTALSVTSSAMAKQQCDDTEALLKVSFTIDEAGWYDLYPLNYTDWRWNPDLVVRPSGNTGNSTSNTLVEYEYFEDLVDFETCIPKEGACVELTVSILPTDAYSITWNGEAVEVGQEFNRYGFPITTTEMGSYCAPICNESTEALFDYQYWTSAWGLVDAYHVKDKSDNVVLGCENEYGTCGESNSFSMYKYRECLPKDSCYQFLTGHGTQLTPVEDSIYVPSISLKFDDEEVEESDSWRFISTSFGSHCVPDCNTEDESSVEFLMYRKPDDSCGSPRPDLDYNWDLTMKNTDGSSAIASSGVVPHCPDTTLFREVLCLPKDSCASFHIESLNDKFTNEAVYSLKMDGVSYRSQDSYFGLNETTNLGTCSVGALCDPSSQALFELELQTPTEYLFRGEPSSVIPRYEMYWFFRSNSLGFINDDTFLTDLSYNDAAYNLGAVYRTIECVPNEQCKYDFNMTSTSPVETYTIMRNGAKLSSFADSSGSVEATAFGDNCRPESKQAEESNKLSGGAIAGIVVACLVVVAWILMCVGYLWRKKNDQVQAAWEQDPLTESLLSDTL